MAEIIGSIAAVIQLADCSLAFAQTLTRLFHEADTLLEDVENFAAQTQSFSDIVSLAHATLYKHCSPGQHDSPIIDRIVNYGVLAGLSRQSSIVLRRLRHADRQVEAMKSRFRWVTRIRWFVSKPAILELSPEMEKVKTSLHIVLVMVQLEKSEYQMQRTSASDTEEVEMLWKTM